VSIRVNKGGKLDCFCDKRVVVMEGETGWDSFV
jgi:hypothetical protein